MSLRRIIDNIGIKLEDFGRNISQKNKAVSLGYRRTDNPKNVEVLAINKYGEVINTTLLRVLPLNYQQLGI